MQKQESKIVAHGELPRQFVMFAIPCYDRRIAHECFQSCVQTEWQLHKNKISSSYRFVTGDQFIAKARNRLVTDFLTEKEFVEATDLFFIDDDVGFQPEKVVELLKRPEAVVGGVYPQKIDEPSFPCTFELQDGKFLQNADGLYSASLAPLGFMRIKRWLLEELVKGKRLYRDDNGDGTSGIRYNLFEAGLLPDWQNWSGEDYDFCCKVRGIGEKIWIDPDITFAHRGQKRWEGNLAAFMNTNAEKIQQKVEEAQAQLEKAALEAPIEAAA